MGHIEYSSQEAQIALRVTVAIYPSPVYLGSQLLIRTSDASSSSLALVLNQEGATKLLHINPALLQ